jgi:hypothetical protein
MNIEQLVKWEFAEETEVLREISPDFHFIHMTWPGSEPELSLWEAGD